FVFLAFENFTCALRTQPCELIESRTSFRSFPCRTAKSSRCEMFHFPPEDVGGSWGYADFLAAITKPSHPEHDNMLDWYGDDFDPAFFDHTRVNYRLYGMKV
ncbi:plasmid pRiA4b ORF-3 family protein, partial [Pseudomonas syringae group genomosp. 3]